MTYQYADAAEKTITKSIPTVNAEGNVILWNIEVTYLLNDYKSIFRESSEIEPIKTPEEFTKSELFNLVNMSQLDAVYDSQYVSVNLPSDSTTTLLSDFNVNQLS
jgi:hypothetical protein